MRSVIVSCFLLITNNVFAANPDLTQVRVLYTKAATEEKHCKALLELLQPVNDKSPATYTGYKACAMMIMAKYVFNPFSKLSYFRKGRNMLEKAIAAETGNIELRFLRLSVQQNAPAFLGYKSKITTDKEFLLRMRGSVSDRYLQRMITSVL